MLNKESLIPLPHRLLLLLLPLPLLTGVLVDHQAVISEWISQTAQSANRDFMQM